MATRDPSDHDVTLDRSDTGTTGSGAPPEPEVCLVTACVCSPKHAGGSYHAEGVRGIRRLLGTSLGAIGWIGGVVPLLLTVALTALELLVAFQRAYVFAILTCI